MFKLYEQTSNRDSKRKTAIAAFATREEADAARKEVEDKIRLMSCPGCFYSVEEVNLTPVVIGGKAQFFSSLQGTDSAGISPSRYTGQIVTVIRDITEENAKDDGLEADEREPMFVVLANDGTEFAAWESELNGDVKSSGICYDYPEWNDTE